MGQKVHPRGLRVGVIKNWSSRWIGDKKQCAQFVIEDNQIRKAIKKDFYQARISEMVIERNNKNEVKITIYASKPGVIIGKSGAQLEQVRNKMQKTLNKEVFIGVREIKKSDLNSQVVAENIAAQLEKRVSFRKAMKQAMQRTMKSGAKGIKVAVSGRLGGAEMARTEFYSEGTVPLQTIRADIDYGFAEADTTYGKLGVKVWIYKGEVLGNKAERLYGKKEQKEFKNNKRTPRSNNRRGKKAGEEVSNNAVNAKEN